ncbi:MAG: HD domain-containing protein [Acidobacteria bacterium]|nr:HD domain-containing protein [Acidobacteriota bacterium]
MPTLAPKRVGLQRLRILWIMLGALLVVSVVPIALYHRKVTELSTQKLASSERLQQIEITKSLAEEVHLYESSVHQQLNATRQILSLSGLLTSLEDPKRASQVTALLENLISSNPNILYVTALSKNAKGQRAGEFPADQDPFVNKEMVRAFTLAMQRAEFHSNPLSYGPENRPAIVVAQPLTNGAEFDGMLAAIISLDPLVKRLRETSLRHREMYIVDRAGRIVAHADTRKHLPGTDVSATNGVVARFKESPTEVRNTETVTFTMKQGDQMVEMVGAFSPVPELHWAVIAQRESDKAREDAGVDELNAQALRFVIAMIIVALILGYSSAVIITAPIHGLAESTQAISRGEFSQRAVVKGAREISELAETFNMMAGNIETYVEQLKQAAEENRELFIGSIRMLAAAIDEKDPYTRGHSGRVAKYSVILGEELQVPADELDRLRISALLHDVGKIGIDDRVLKKPGSLTPEEFEVMKQHPLKGANIMRPVAQLKEMLPGIELHHEHVDGRGYPYGLRGEQIPLMARIIAVADTLDAMTTNRPYQTAMDISYAMGKIRQLGGTKFDPTIVTALDAVVQSGKLRLSATLVEV